MAPLNAATEQPVASQAAMMGRMKGPALRAAARSKTAAPVLLALFFLTVLLPISFSLGGIRINPSRLLILLTAVPFGIRLFSGSLGGFTRVDACMLGFAVLMVISLIYHHGGAQIAFALSQVLETFGAYMMGRALIRSLQDYRGFISVFLLALLILLPLAVYELFTFHMVLSDILGRFFAVIQPNFASRYGLARVQVVFPHAILYGLFCSMALASAFYLYRARPFRRLIIMILIVGMTVMSLSSAPMLSVAMQFGLILWGKITQGAWKILVGIVLSIFLFLQLFTGRGAFVIFIETMTLDPETGWFRIAQWNWGWYNIWQSPIFGIGLNDWVRAFWMLTASVDDYWLLVTMRYGLPALVLILGAFLLHIFAMLRVRTLSQEAALVRTGYVITLVGMMFILVTVALWDTTQVFVMFFLGAGAFLYTAGAGITAPESSSGTAPETGAAPDAPRGPAYSRFPQTPGRRAAVHRAPDTPVRRPLKEPSPR